MKLVRYGRRYDGRPLPPRTPPLVLVLAVWLDEAVVELLSTVALMLLLAEGPSEDARAILRGGGVFPPAPPASIDSTMFSIFDTFCRMTVKYTDNSPLSIKMGGGIAEAIEPMLIKPGCWTWEVEGGCCCCPDSGFWLLLSISLVGLCW